LNSTTLAILNMLHDDTRIINRLSFVNISHNHCPLNNYGNTAIERQVESYFVDRLMVVSHALYPLYKAIRHEIDWRYIAELLSNKVERNRQYRGNRLVSG
jgi:hypothetical protein